MECRIGLGTNSRCSASGEPQHTEQDWGKGMLLIKKFLKIRISVSTITEDGKADLEIRRRIGKAKAKFWECEEFL